VGLTAVALGLPSLLALPFASVSRSRIATGDLTSAVAVVGALGLAGLVLPWLGAFVASIVSADSRRAAFARGLFGVLAILGVLGVSGLGARAVLPTYGEFARYSIGGGAWAACFAGLVLIASSRRDLGVRSLGAWVVTLGVPVGIAVLAVTGVLSDLGIMVEYRNAGSRFAREVRNHLLYAGISIGTATVIGLGLGILAYRNRAFARPVFAMSNLFQTIPGLAIIGLLVAPFAAIANAIPELRTIGFGGLGWAPVIFALTLYALLAVVRNTYAGLASVSESVVESGLGMGMSPRQVLLRVQLPLALPILFGGVRTSAQQTIGNATLAAFAAAGGMGLFIFMGLSQQADDLVLLGALTVVAFALTVDVAMRGLQRALSPRQTSGSTRP
jgi:osmoprotectant transport system permease protein